MNFSRKLYAPDFMLKPDQKLQQSYKTSDFYKIFLMIAWPAVAESFLLGLVNFIDALMVSTINTTAIAAVGLTSQPRLIFYAIFLALSIGVTAVVSRRKGEGRQEDANKSLAEAVSLCIILGAAVVAVAVIFATPILRFSGAKSDTIGDATTYFRITMIGMFFTSVSLIINAAQRGSGNTRISMITSMTANVVNCIFNALLINGLFFFPRLEVAGAAIATMIGNIVACGMSLYSVLKPGRFLKLKFKSLFRFSKGVLSSILSVSSSAAVEQLFMRFGFFITAKLVAELGTLDFTTHTICMNIVNLSFCFGEGLSVSASALVGQNLGKKRPDFSIIYGKTAQRIGFIVSILLMLLFSFGGNFLINLFMSGEAEVQADADRIVELGVKILLILAVMTPTQISQVIFSGALRGAGDTKYTAMVSFICIALVRPVFTYLLCYGLDFAVIGAWLAMTIDQVMRLILMFTRFSSGKWTKIKL